MGTCNQEGRHRQVRFNGRVGRLKKAGFDKVIGKWVGQWVYPK